MVAYGSTEETLDPGETIEKGQPGPSPSSSTESDTALLPTFLSGEELQAFYAAMEELGRASLRVPAPPGDLEAQLDAIIAADLPPPEVSLPREDVKTFLKGFVVMPFEGFRNPEIKDLFSALLDKFDFSGIANEGLRLEFLQAKNHFDYFWHTLLSSIEHRGKMDEVKSHIHAQKDQASAALSKVKEGRARLQELKSTRDELLEALKNIETQIKECEKELGDQTLNLEKHKEELIGSSLSKSRLTPAQQTVDFQIQEYTGYWETFRLLAMKLL